MKQTTKDTIYIISYFLISFIGFYFYVFYHPCTEGVCLYSDKETLIKKTGLILWIIYLFIGLWKLSFR